MAEPPYRVTELLHQGKRTTIYRAVRRSDGQSVVIKVPGSRQPSSRDIERLRNEYEIGSKVKLRGTVRPLALDTYEGLPALVLENFDGVPLDRLVGAPMEPGRFLRIAARIAEALAELHRHDLVHRDIKPQNILVDEERGEIRITDLGIASMIPREQRSGRASALIEGSLPYMSPEQTGRMNRTVDNRTDFYSLGVTFYQMLTGRLPFEAADPMGWVHCHIALLPPPPSDVSPGVPAALSRIVMKLMSKVAEDRYQSAAGLKVDLERCLAEWREKKTIGDFAPGERDISERFQVPQKLYGRDREIAALLDAFERVVAGGTPELVLISGYSGIGKSSLVHELNKPIVRERGFFIFGKFDQYKRNIPYATVAQAFRDLVLEILSGSEEYVAAWKERLQAALGINGALIVDVIPQVEMIIGKQPPVTELPLSEAQSRFNRIFRQFIAAFTSKEHPLALFLDDLQWVDPASLGLLREVVAHPDTRHLLVIGAYRDNEVSPSHPLMVALEELRRTPTVTHDLVLAPLSVGHLGELVADAMRCTPKEAAPLAALLEEKTGGNPFFVLQFLETLYGEHLIDFDPEGPAWRWDVARIRAKGYTDNVVDFMVRKLKRLPPPTQEALKRAACVGNVADLPTLAAVCERSEEETPGLLWEAVREGLLTRKDHAYTFLHDRVQQAAYSMIPEDQRAFAHLRIGRLMVGSLSRRELEEKIFDVVGQLNGGASLLTDPQERIRVAELNLVAGRRAMASTAYAAAAEHLAAGTALLPPDAWTRHYELAWGLHFERSQCEFLRASFPEAERLFDVLLREARTKIHKADVYRVKIELHVTRSQNAQAVASALECLRLFGIEMPAHPTREEVQAEYERVWRNLGGRKIEDLFDLPLMTDPEIQAAMRVLGVLFAPAYFTDSNLLCLHLCAMVNLSLRHGNCDASTHGYAWFGIVLGPVFHRYQDGQRFGKLACDLVEKYGFLAYKAKSLYSLELIVFWTQPIKAAIDSIREAFRVGAETGDVTVTCYCCNHVAIDVLTRGDRLEEVDRECDRGLDFVRKTGFRDVADIIVGIQRFVQNLRGLTATFSTFDDAEFSEKDFEAKLTGDRMPTMVCWYWVMKLMARFMSGDCEEAAAAAARAEQLVWASLSHPQLLEYHFYRALTLAALCDRASPEKKKAWLEELKLHQEQLREWAGNCPETFLNRHALVSAEIARVRGDDARAMKLYEEAIRSARENGFVQNEGLSYELASRFYRSRGFDAFADAYLQEARSCYARWGADGKVAQLDRAYPHLVERRPIGAGGTLLARTEQFDLLSVVKAMQTVSQEIVLDKLLRTLMQVVIEQGGAQRGCLLLERGGQLLIDAEAELTERGTEVTVLQSAPAAGSARVPESLVSLAQRTKESVILADAAGEGRFASDPYLMRRRPKSVLCLPILRRGELVGVLYLENNLATGAFTPEKLTVLRVLAAQAAISLENALLLSREQAARAAAEEAERCSAFLAEAGELLGESLEIERIFGRLVRLSVRFLADWAMIDLAEGRTVRRVAWAHADASREELLAELQRRYPPTFDSPHPSSRVLRSGEPLLLPGIDADLLRSTCVDDEHARIIRELGTTSGLVVPLMARGRPLGTISLGSASRRFGKADLDLVRELARRAGVAIDNARLYAETQEAARVRREFISIASHELKTPMTSMVLSVESLKEGLERKPAGPQVKKLVDILDRQSNRLVRLIQGLLDVTRIEQGRFPIEPEEMNLADSVREVVAHFERDLAKAGCAVSVEAPAPVRGRWDRLKLEQVVTNLLSNAMKFGAGRSIDISVVEEGGRARLSVRDRGIGIDPARQRQLFQSFGRAVTAGQYAGLGLGLYVCRRIVEAHEGTIRVISREGEGSTFIVDLPCRGPLSAPSP